MGAILTGAIWLAFHSNTNTNVGELQSRTFLLKFNLNEILIVGAIWTCEGSRKNVDVHLTYKIQDIVFPIHGPHRGITSINIQRKNNNYIEYSYTMTYSSI
jgi:hypothetical protein